VSTTGGADDCERPRQIAATSPMMLQKNVTHQRSIEEMI
jgi:hypothetical protein